MSIKSRFTLVASALALGLSTATASAAPAPVRTITGSLIPQTLQTVKITSPSMALIRAIAIRPIVTPLVGGGRCAVTGAVYSDDAAVADGPMPGIRTALVSSNGQVVDVRTDYYGVYHAVVQKGTWRETRPQVGALPFGVHPTRPRVQCD